jgi:hypothetical protein
LEKEGKKYLVTEKEGKRSLVVVKESGKYHARGK